MKTTLLFNKALKTNSVSKLAQNKIKKKGQVYTPQFIVKNILDTVGYKKGNILKKHIIDNSAGDGVFLFNIVDRYIKEYIKENKKVDLNLKKHLEKYVHGIELQKDEFKKCILNLNILVAKYNLINIKWDIINNNTLEVKNYDNKMDFVVGNPPYVRVHNLKNAYKNVKKYKFSKNGMTDLYIVFFEIGFNMLNKKGKMCIISPSSFLNSLAGLELRRYIKKKKKLLEIIDLEHFQPFEDITTYTTISLFDNNYNKTYIKYYKYDKDKKKKNNMIKINYDDLFIDEKIFLVKKDISELLKKIFSYEDKNNIEVKNGFATLSDSIFIKNSFHFNELVIDIKKSSTGKNYRCLYPYDNKARPLNINFIKKKHNIVYRYLVKNKIDLLNRSIKNKDEWYLFGRSQGLNDTNKVKISVNTIIKDLNSLKISKEKKGVGVYSGLYILENNNFSKIKKILKNDIFLSYVKSLKKYKNGGYYSISSRDLRVYLNFKLNK